MSANVDALLARLQTRLRIIDDEPRDVAACCELLGAPLLLAFLLGTVAAFGLWRQDQLLKRAECASDLYGELTEETWKQATRERCNPSEDR